MNGNEFNFVGIERFSNNDRPGLLIRFLRHVNQNNSNENEIENNEIFWSAIGYFDRITFECCGSISEIFLPRNDHEELSKSCETQYLGIAQLILEREGNYLDRLKKIIQPNNEIPLLIITGLKIKRHKSIFNQLSEDIAKILNKLKEGKNYNAHFELFSTLGFSDLVILFRSNSYLCILKALIGISNFSKTDDSPSFFYSIPAFQSNIKELNTLDSEELEVYRLISATKVNEKQLNKEECANYSILFGQYDFLSRIIKKADIFEQIRLNESPFSMNYHKFLLGYPTRKILSND